ncbi:MAG TPA: hypothetical protein DEG06_05100 [Lachnospiraceae bacterium]|jgi:hypothetical protein|nr:hypothetical protein [Lachnospiraceae bacterium]HBY71601.1 hypothetical protein [Lachnospiraceae bacterium]HCA69358.1 hypothetical protein [Lachnospiraceae bacterium]HCM14035.1 hypothetical protein [Lachnospiraceae bacterium]
MKAKIYIDEIVKVRHLIEVEAEDDDAITSALDQLEMERHDDFDSAEFSLRNNYNDLLTVVNVNREYSEDGDGIEYDYEEDDEDE